MLRKKTIIKLFLIPLLIWLVVQGVSAASGIVRALARAVHPHQSAVLPETAGWYYQQSCGLPAGAFDDLSLDVEQAQQAYAATAINLTTQYATQIRTDAASARNCVPSVMLPADRKLYLEAISQAATAGRLGITDPYAMGSHLGAAATLLARVAAQTHK